jgi:hypothetical protein
MDPDLLTRIALIDPEHWDAGPERVNPMIHDMWMERRIAQVIAENPLALRIVFNRSKGKLEAHPLEERDLSEIVDEIRRALREFVARCKKRAGSGNLGPAMLTTCGDTIEELRRDLSKFKENPRQLYRVLEESRRELQVIAKQEGFEGDHLLDRLLGNLENQADDICVAAPEVLEEVKRRLDVRAQLFTTEQKRAAIRMSGGMFQDSHGLLRAATAQAMLVIFDDARSEGEKQAAWTFLLGALPRGAREMRAEDREGAATKDDPSVLEKAAGYADKAARIDRGIDAAQEALEEGGPWALELYTQIASGNWFGLGSQ